MSVTLGSYCTLEIGLYSDFPHYAVRPSNSFIVARHFTIQ